MTLSGRPFALVMIIAFSNADPRTGAADWKAGVAKTAITPEQPMWMSGYAARTKPAEGKLHDLWAKALAVEDPQGTRGLLISLDLVGISRPVADTVCERLAEKLQLKREAICIATSHTHSGPVTEKTLLHDLSPGEQAKVVAYTRSLEDKMVAVAEAAFAQLRPARLAWGIGSAGYAVNRRNNPEAKVPELRAAGLLKGPVDHDVPVLQVADRDGTARAIVFGYACHCTVLSGYQWCGDHAGYAQIELEKAYPGATALFFAGCGGDQNPLPRRTVELAEKYGRELADAVSKTLRGTLHPVAGRFAQVYTRLDLPFDKLPTRTDLEQQLDSKNTAERLRAKMLLERLERDGKLSPTYPYPVQVWQLGGELNWVILGGEVVVDYSIRLKHELGKGHTWVTGYANDVMAYIPSLRVLEEGGYEGGGSMVYYGLPSRWGPAVEQLIVAKVHELVRQLKPDAPKPTGPADPKEELPRIAPTEPAHALQTFRIQGGFRMELVAAEPLVVDPIDMAFDEDGRLWVIEMIDYPFGPQETYAPQGRVRLLEDSDGDGRMDRSFVVADKLAWPTGLALWDGGVFVAVAPDILYFKDSDGDHVADRREVVFTGLGKANVQALVNNLRWGLDNWFYGASGGNGGTIESRRRPGAPAVALAGRDFRFRPGGEFEALSGGGQFGHTLDDFNRRFACSNSNHARHIVLESRYLARNPLLAVPGVILSIASDGDSAPVFRSSPPEPWRLVRTRMRVAGQVPGPIEHGGHVTGYFTSATGITVYRGTALGDDSYGNLFIGDVASNLVHRKKLTAEGVTFRADRREPNGEFIASTDNWFRPVNFANGPDGALYICDMYRECIEHPASIPEIIKQYLDLTSGKDRGRIWRVLREGAPRFERPQLGRARTAELVQALRRRDAWWRETAARLLYQRQDTSAVAPLEAATRDDRPETRVAALWALDGLASLRPELVAVALRDPSADVREQAVRLAERFPSAHELHRSLLALAGDPSPRVRLQLAYTLGELDEPEVTGALAQIGGRDSADPWIRTALLSSVNVRTTAGSARPTAVLRELNRDATRASSLAPELFGELLRMIAAQASADELQGVLRWITSELPADADERRWGLLRGLCDGLQRTGRPLARRIEPGGDLADLAGAITSVFETARRSAQDERAGEGRRVAATRLLSHAPFPATGKALAHLLNPREPQAVQLAAVRSVAAHAEPAAAATLLAPWKTYSQPVRREVFEALFSRPAHLAVLLDQIESGQVRRGDIELDRRKQLLGHSNASIRARAAKLLGNDPIGDRSKVIALYRPALDRPGRAPLGKAVFQKHCATCHKIEGQGHEIGPDLATVRERTADALLEQILDPNREINPVYLNYTVATKDGRVLTGLIAGESATSITLKRAEGASDTVLRADIEELASTGLSLMPEGLEKDVTPEQVADVIAYLRRAGL